MLLTKKNFANIAVSAALCCGLALPAFTTNAFADEIEDNTPYTVAYAKSKSIDNFIQIIGPEAQVIAQENNIYASIMIAQAINESAAGTSGLGAAPYYNLFGIKGTGTAGSVKMNTKEDNGKGEYYTIVAAFRKYNNWKESMEDYAKLIRENSGFRGSWKENAATPQQAAKALQGNYATSTSYANGLMTTIRNYNLEQFDTPLGYSMDDARVTSVCSVGQTLKNNKYETSEDFVKELYQNSYNIDMNFNNIYDNFIDIDPDQYHNSFIGDLVKFADNSYGVMIGNGRFYTIQNNKIAIESLDTVGYEPVQMYRLNSVLTDEQRYQQEIENIQDEVKDEIKSIEQDTMDRIKDILE